MNARVRMTEGGRIVIPAAARKKLGLKVGDELMIDVDDFEIRIKSPIAAMRYARELLKANTVDTGYTMEDFFSDRREAARLEDEEMDRWFSDADRP